MRIGQAGANSVFFLTACKIASIGRIFSVQDLMGRKLYERKLSDVETRYGGYFTFLVSQNKNKVRERALLMSNLFNFQLMALMKSLCLYFLFYLSQQIDRKRDWIISVNVLCISCQNSRAIIIQFLFIIVDFDVLCNQPLRLQNMTHFDTTYFNIAITLSYFSIEQSISNIELELLRNAISTNGTRQALNLKLCIIYVKWNSSGSHIFLWAWNLAIQACEYEYEYTLIWSASPSMLFASDWLHVKCECVAATILLRTAEDLPWANYWGSI